MRTPDATVAVAPGAFVVHPPGEVHEYENGPQRTLLFRVRYGADMAARHLDWRGRAGFTQSAEDADYYRHQSADALARDGRLMTGLLMIDRRAVGHAGVGIAVSWRLRIAPSNRRRIPCSVRFFRQKV